MCRCRFSSITVDRGTSTEPLGANAWYAGFLLLAATGRCCVPGRAIQPGPTGVIRGGRSFDYDHYSANKMSTRWFLDTLLRKRRKVQK